MGVAYSQDLRERVLSSVDGGLGAHAAARPFRVSVSHIYKALMRRRTTGKSHGARPRRRPAASWRHLTRRFEFGFTRNPTLWWPSCKRGCWPTTAPR
jgi:transposase